MPLNKRRLFENLSIETWHNLAIVALIAFYIPQILWSLTQGWLLIRGIGSDFRAFWSAGVIANTSGYADVYNLDLIREFQIQTFSLYRYDTSFEIIPFPFLPIFIIPFQILSLLPPIPSFYVWSILNLVSFFVYSNYFLRKMKIPNWRGLSLISILAYPTFSNFFFGQINVPLFICIGEFIRYALNKREFQSGLWLGGLILKPQLLILIVPIFVLQRKWRLLTGFITTLFVLTASSLLLGGLSSIINLITLLMKYLPGIPTNDPENMMNWRMVGERLSDFLPRTISWEIVWIGLVATLLTTLFLWRKPIPTSSIGFLTAITGTLAATLAITWHSHIHTAMILIPPVVYLYTKKAFPIQLFNSWMLGIPFLVLFLALWVGLFGLVKYDALQGLIGFCMLVFNLVILLWSLHTTSAFTTKTKRFTVVDPASRPPR